MHRAAKSTVWTCLTDFIARAHERGYSDTRHCQNFSSDRHPTVFFRLTLDTDPPFKGPIACTCCSTNLYVHFGKSSLILEFYAFAMLCNPSIIMIKLSTSQWKSDVRARHHVLEDVFDTKISTVKP